MPIIDNEIREVIYARDGYRCLRCHREDRLTIDHIIPLSKGGSNSMDNYQTLCSPCNLWKGNMVKSFIGNKHIVPPISAVEEKIMRLQTGTTMRFKKR